ncbi:MAG: hypothetical protein K6G80_05275 [Treponema sp.]|nr:hypothetical protein [Treponema sp.]
MRLPLSEHASSIPLLSTSASLPPLVSRLPDIVQYYTVLNAGTLSDLKSSLSPYIPPEKNFDALWRRADGACRALFSLSLEDVLYSWTGSEFAAFGLEGHSLPVFAVQIRDEAKRAEIFDQVLSSFLIKDDMSLIIDGVRLPRITVPSFIESLLAVCNISIPSPYYLVHDGYIFFSVAPEALSAVYTSMKTSGRLSKTAYWRAVSDSLSNDVQVSLFYNLERSIPFFLRTPGVHTKILELYTIGRADLRIKDGDAVVSLHAVARHAQDARAVPGFPVPLEGKAVPEILAEPGKNPSMLFWLEDGTKICSFDSSSMEQKSIVLPERLTLSSPNQAVNKNGVLWAVTQSGAVYLFDRNLEVISPFPVLTGERPSAGGAAYGGDALLVPLTGGSLCLVNSSGSVSLIQLPATGQLRSAPAVSGTTAAVYEKSFAGKIWLIENGALTNGDNPLSVPGIAFGSPALIRKGSLLYVAFITQAGAFYLWENGELRDGFPLQLDGVFYLNAEASGSYFYVLDSTAVLTRIGVDGSILRVAVPASTARNGFLTVAEPEKSGRASLYVCPDGNTLYGFSSSLELLSGFPVSGWGRPAFADVNGDKRADCFTLTLDNTLTAWNVR